MSTTTSQPATSAQANVGTPLNEVAFVTGAGGLLGSHVVRHLAAANRKVKALYRGSIPNGMDLPGVEWVKGDILDIVFLEEIMRQVQQVYHCAAVVSFNPSEKRQMFKINVEGTANVVNAAINTGVRKVVFVSSVAAIGRANRHDPVNETMQWTEENNNSNYGKSKYLAEMEVWRGIGEGLEAVIVNPSIILGASDWSKGSAAIFKSAYDEFPWYSDGGGGFVDVYDVARAMVKLMDSDISGQRFIVSAENRPFSFIFGTAAKYFGKRPPHKKITPFLAAIVWRLEAIRAAISGKKPLLTKETAETGLATVEYDHSKLLQYLPDFAFTPLEDSIKRVCEEFKQTSVLEK